MAVTKYLDRVDTFDAREPGFKSSHVLFVVKKTKIEKEAWNGTLVGTVVARLPVFQSVRVQI